MLHRAESGISFGHVHSHQGSVHAQGDGAAEGCGHGEHLHGPDAQHHSHIFIDPRYQRAQTQQLGERLHTLFDQLMAGIDAPPDSHSAYLTRVILGIIDDIGVAFEREPDLRGAKQRIKAELGAAITRLMLTLREDPLRLDYAISVELMRAIGTLATVSARLLAPLGRAMRGVRNSLSNLWSRICGNNDGSNALSNLWMGICRRAEQAGDTLDYYGTKLHGFLARMSREGFARAAVIGVTWPPFTLASEVAEHLVLGPFGAVCITSQLIYWHNIDALVAKAEDAVRGRLFRKGDLSGKERKVLRKALRRAATAIKRQAMETLGKGVTQGAFIRELTAAPHGHRHLEEFVEKVARSDLWVPMARHLVARPSKENSQPTFNNSPYFADAMRMTERPPEQGIAVAKQWHDGLDAVSSMVASYVSGVCHADGMSAGKATSIHTQLGRFRRVLSQMRLALPMTAALGDERDAVAVANALQSAVHALRAIFLEAGTLDPSRQQPKDVGRLLIEALTENHFGASEAVRDSVAAFSAATRTLMRDGGVSSRGEIAQAVADAP